MTLTLLLDLDDTLLKTNQDTFVPAYFQALSTKLAPNIDAQLVARALFSSTNTMNQSGDPSRTLSDVFNETFYPQLNIRSGALDSAIINFYDTVFPTLRPITAQIPDAKPFIDWAHSQGYRIAIATDPLLPRKATYQRVRWAGFDPDEFELISTYEDFHFSKTHNAYYAEVLGRMGWPDGPILMVGNDMDRDILPAKRLGLATFFISDGTASKSGPEAGLGGSLSDLRRYLESTDLQALTPAFDSSESILGILSSTPAVLDGLLHGLNADAWLRKPSSSEWTMTELICHLRDTEREIHQMQLDLFAKQDVPFIPRPDTGVWASQRNYLHENGAAALDDFISVRRGILEKLSAVSREGWERKARHAIFGPTNFREVVGFMADHDRLHIQQAWSTLKKL